RNIFVVGALLVCCGGRAFAGVDDVWAASPATTDTQWAQAYAAPVNPANNGSSVRRVLYSGRSTVVTVGVDPTMTTLYVSFDLDGRGITQQMIDIDETVGRGNFRVYNRGGENADRPYDALIRVSRSGNSLTLRGEGIWTGAPVIYTVIGYGG
ncbi:hypothetical protein, partial [Aeromonas hydrophila]|uniref:hypothetical protein n=1 Tax=Aeromonas hydrophila TaxID=644 RepID=UPI00225B4694